MCHNFKRIHIWCQFDLLFAAGKHCDIITETTEIEHPHVHGIDFVVTTIIYLETGRTQVHGM